MKVREQQPCEFAPWGPSLGVAEADWAYFAELAKELPPSATDTVEKLAVRIPEFRIWPQPETVWEWIVAFGLELFESDGLADRAFSARNEAFWEGMLLGEIRGRYAQIANPKSAESRPPTRARLLWHYRRVSRAVDSFVLRKLQPSRLAEHGLLQSR